MTAGRWAAIWSRVFNLNQRELDAAAARMVLGLKFKRQDVARIWC